MPPLPSNSQLPSALASLAPLNKMGTLGSLMAEGSYFIFASVIDDPSTTLPYVSYNFPPCFRFRHPHDPRNLLPPARLPLCLLRISPPNMISLGIYGYKKYQKRRAKKKLNQNIGEAPSVTDRSAEF